MRRADDIAGAVSLVMGAALGAAVGGVAFATFAAVKVIKAVKG